MNLPLLPYSRLVFELNEEVPGVYEFTYLLRINSSDVDVARLHAALRTAIRNHPVFSMKLDSSGHHPCKLSDELHGPYHSVTLAEKDGYVMLKASFNRILGDWTSLLVLADDTSRAYRGLELEPDRYSDYLRIYWERCRSLQYTSLKTWFDNEFGRLSCPVSPHTDFPLDSQAFQYSGILIDSIPCSRTILQNEHVTTSGFVSLCATLAIMDYENVDEAALTWAYAGRDSLMEQRIFGSLHKDIPFVIRRSGNPAELFGQARRQLRSGIAHSDFPYTLTPPHTEVWNYAVNVLQQPDIAEVLSTFPFNVDIVDIAGNNPQIAYSLLDIEVSETGDESLKLLYRYSVAHYKKESMQRFAAFVRSNATWLTGGHQRMTRKLEEIVTANDDVADCIIKSIVIAAERCPDRHMNPVRTLDGLYAFLDRFLVSKPWESLGISHDEMSLFRRIDQSTGYFLYIFDQPLDELKDKGYLYPSVQYIPTVASWIKDFNNAWRDYLDSPDSWDDSCLELVSSDPLFGLNHGWYESPSNWHCWNDFFSRRLSGPASRPLDTSAVIAPTDGILQDTYVIRADNCLELPDGLYIKTASVRSVAELLGNSPYRDCFADGLFLHQMLDFYDYHRLHSPINGTIMDIRIIDGISGSGGVVVWNSMHSRYEYANPGETGFQMHETRGVAVIDAGELGLVALVAVGMAQVCSVNWLSGLKAGNEVHKGDELGFFLCGGSDVVLLFQKNVNLRLIPKSGQHLLMGTGLFENIYNNDYC